MNDLEAVDMLRKVLAHSRHRSKNESHPMYGTLRLSIQYGRVSSMVSEAIDKLNDARVTHEIIVKNKAAEREAVRDTKKALKMADTSDPIHKVNLRINNVERMLAEMAREQASLIAELRNTSKTLSNRCTDLEAKDINKDHDVKDMKKSIDDIETRLVSPLDDGRMG